MVEVFVKYIFQSSVRSEIIIDTKVKTTSTNNYTAFIQFSGVWLFF